MSWTRVDAPRLPRRGPHVRQQVPTGPVLAFGQQLVRKIVPIVVEANGC